MKYGWRFPSDCGDFALIGLESRTDGKAGFRIIGADLVEAERVSLRLFCDKAKEKGWELETNWENDQNSCKITVWAPADTSYPDVAALVGQETTGLTATMTAVRLSDGTIKTSAMSPKQLSEIADKNKNGNWWPKIKKFFTGGASRPVLEVASEPVIEVASEPVVAVTVPRPTNCCPYTIPSSAIDTRADLLLMAFCTPEQQETWREVGWLEAKGQVSGDTYRIAHRHSPVAVAQGKATWLITYNCVVHAHLTWYPPAEEVLALKLAVEHRESWIRNRSTILTGKVPVFNHPFRGEETQGLDGTYEAGVMTEIGSAFELITKR